MIGVSGLRAVVSVSAALDKAQNFFKNVDIRHLNASSVFQMEEKGRLVASPLGFRFSETALRTVGTGERMFLSGRPGMNPAVNGFRRAGRNVQQADGQKRAVYFFIAEPR